MDTLNEAPHLAPEACFICGYGEHEPAPGHNYWPNSKAEVAFAAMDDGPTFDAAAAYVAEHRPY